MTTLWPSNWIVYLCSLWTCKCLLIMRPTMHVLYFCFSHCINGGKKSHDTVPLDLVRFSWIDRTITIIYTVYIYIFIYSYIRQAAVMLISYILDRFIYVRIYVYHSSPFWGSCYMLICTQYRLPCSLWQLNCGIFVNTCVPSSTHKALFILF